jgi:F0F1-type ATP synthase assembly protein I
MLSAWGFALVIASCLFLWLGNLLDELLGTAPKFMVGLFIMSIIGCFIELYQEALKIMISAKNEQRKARNIRGILPAAKHNGIIKKPIRNSGMTG